MSVPDQTPYIIHNANGLTTVFAFEFYIIAASDLRVAVNGTDVTSGFTVSGTGNTHGGDITFITPPAAGSELLIERKISARRLTEYQDNGDLLAVTVNKDFDRLWMSNKQSEIYLDLALQRPITGGEFDAKGFQIKNLEKPNAEGDAATKGYSDELYNEFSGKADQLNDAFANGMYGYVLIDSFQKGATLTLRNNALRDERDDSYYRWNSALPKVVPIGSLPENTGGIKTDTNPSGLWVSVGDASVRPLLVKKQGVFSISLLENGGVDDKETDNTVIIQHLINASDNAILMIESGCLWHPSVISFKDNVRVIDYSGWDDKYKKWTSQIKHFLDTDQPQTKNANEWITLARHHPAVVVDNYGNNGDPEGPERRASVIFRYQGVSMARVGIGSGTDDTTFVITDSGLGARFAFLNTDEGDFELSFNGQPIRWIDYAYQSKRDGNQVHRKISHIGFSIVEQHYSGASSLSSQITYGYDGSISYRQKDANTLVLSATGEMYGVKKLILAVASKTLTRNESGAILVNAPGTATSGYVLPLGGTHSGISFEAINTTGVRLAISTYEGESFVDGTTRKEIITKGSHVSVIYLGSGLWHLSTIQ